MIAHDLHWIPFEIIHYHKTAIKIIGVKKLEEFGKQMNSWGAVDIFAGYLAEPAAEVRVIINIWCISQIKVYSETKHAVFLGH